MKNIIGFIGSGNMGSAIIAGILKSGLVSPENIIASDLSETTLMSLEKTYGIKTSFDNTKVAKESNILFLAVKPGIYPFVIEQIRTHVKEDVTIVVIAAGQSIQTIESLFKRELKIVRVMPNTPALVGEGMAAICPNKQMSKDDLQEIISIFQSIGKAEVIPEYLMDVVTGISGSSPAYVYMFIEAMADAAVAEGMPRAQAYQFAAQAVYGSAKMVLETNMHPGELKDQVSSPGGTTIEAVCQLEKHGLRNAVISAVRACTEKSRSMGETK